jgi:hypothetical protein
MANGLPAWAQQYIDPSFNARFTQGIVGFQRPAHISIENSTFTLVLENGQAIPQGRMIEFVAVDANYGISRIYYPDAYRPGPAGMQRPVPPCWSDNGKSDNDPDQRPSASAADPQSQFCQGCRHNVFGTAKQGLGKACRESKKIVVLYENQPYLLSVAPNSLKGWEKYVDWLQQSGIPLFMVRTQAYFVEDKQSTLAFGAVGYVGSEDNGRFPGWTEVNAVTSCLDQMRGNPQLFARMTGANDVGRTAALPPPKPAPQMPAPGPEWATQQQPRQAPQPAPQAPQPAPQAPQPAPQAPLSQQAAPQFRPGPMAQAPAAQAPVPPQPAPQPVAPATHPSFQPSQPGGFGTFLRGNGGQPAQAPAPQAPQAPPPPAASGFGTFLGGGGAPVQGSPFAASGGPIVDATVGDNKLLASVNKVLGR